MNDYAITATYHDDLSPFQQELANACQDYNGERVDPRTFYREVFDPTTIQSYAHPGTDGPGHKGNPIVLIQRGKTLFPGKTVPTWAYDLKGKVKKKEGEYHTRHTKRIMFNDYRWVDEWRNLDDVQHVMISGLSYIGKDRKLANAVAMHALIFDIDLMDVSGLRNLLYGAYSGQDIYPIPNYVVLSGNGVHLYYTFVEPQPLYHGGFGNKVKKQVNELKMQLTRRLWNPYTIDDMDKGRNPQYQGINQAFRMVGSYTKSLDADHNRYIVAAYKFPVDPYDGLDYFYKYVPKIPKENRYKSQSVFGLEYWKEHNPEWYERRIINGDKSIKYWHVNPRLYEWWLNKIKTEVQFGHRYNSLMCAVAIAVKCDIPKKQVKQDLMDLLPHLSGLKEGDPITPADVREALQSYKPEINTYPMKSIAYLSGVEMQKTKRNGRKQDMHLKGARALQDLYHPNWREGNGRKPKQDIVVQWRQEHPNGKKADCIRETGLSKPTVLKWWDSPIPETVSDPAVSQMDRIAAFYARMPQNVPVPDDDIGLEEQDKAILRALEEPIAGTQMEYDEVFDVVQKIKRKKEDKI